MKNILTLLLYMILTVNVMAQDCTLTANVISFENSDKDVLATFFDNRATVAINTTSPTGENASLLVLDSVGTILSIIPSNTDECAAYYRLQNDVFVDTMAHEFYEIAEISWDSLESSLSTGLQTDSLQGCFVLSNRLRVIDFRLNTFIQLGNTANLVDEDNLNVFGGGTSIGGVLNRNSITSIDVCRIDSTNRAFGQIGAVGPSDNWVVTTREGVVMELLDIPVFDFQSYFQEVEVSPSLHELELFYIVYSGGSDWLVEGENIKTSLCNAPTSNIATVYEINLIECEDTCNDGFLNGIEMTRDDCTIDSSLMCIIADITDVSCFGESTGSATVEASGGAAPYTYLWETGDTTLTADSLSMGVYDVTVTDSLGMTSVCSANINQSDSLSVEIEVNSIANCSASSTVVGGLGPYMYQWSTGEAFIVISNLDSIQSVTVTDVLGCTATATIDASELTMVCGDCGDGVMNGDETGIDCGGICEPCPVVVNLNPLQLVKIAEFVDESDNGFMEEGETVNYIFSVCNAGDVALTQVFINDPLITVMGDTLASLAPGTCNATSFSGNYVLTADDLITEMLVNQATASAVFQDTIMVSDLSDDTNVLSDVDNEGDGEPDDPTILIIMAGCGGTLVDTDMDGICDIEDTDDDDDGVLDVDDAFPLDAGESVDSDGDGFGNNGDFDDDNDQVDDRFDAFPTDPTESLDTDGDGIGDNADMNDDGDACDDLVDNDPLVASEDCLIETGCDQSMIVDDGVVFSGSILTDIGFGVEEVQMSIVSQGVRHTSTTDVEGEYSSSIISQDLDYILRPSKEDVPFAGVSTLDMLFIQRHILRLQRLSNPYKIIAADVSGNFGVSIVDIIVIRQMILGIVDQWNEGLSWKFVDADFDFFDPFVPWPFRSAREISNAQISQCDIDFVAIKLGDVDNSYERDSIETRNIDTYTLRYNKQQLDNGNFKYSFYAPKDELLYGFQFELQDIRDAHIELQSTSLTIKDSDYEMSGDDLKLSWTQPYGLSVAADDVLFTLITKEDIDINLGKSNLNPEIYVDESIEKFSLDFEEIIDLTSLNAVFTPNPFQHSTTLNLTLDDTETVKLTVYDSNGVIHWKASERLSAGQHAIKIPEQNLQQAGIYFYTIESGGQSHSGKLIKSQ